MGRCGSSIGNVVKLERLHSSKHMIPSRPVMTAKVSAPAGGFRWRVVRAREFFWSYQLVVRTFRLTRERYQLGKFVEPLSNFRRSSRKQHPRRNQSHELDERLEKLIEQHFCFEADDRCCAFQGSIRIRAFSIRKFTLVACRSPSLFISGVTKERK